MALSVLLSLSVDSQLILCNCNSVPFCIIETGGGGGGAEVVSLVECTEYFVFDVWVCCFYFCFGNRGNGYYSYEGIGNNFFVDCYSLDF